MLAASGVEARGEISGIEKGGRKSSNAKKMNVA